MHPGVVLYNSVYAIGWPDLDAQRFKLAWQSLVDSCDALRTVFEEVPEERAENLAYYRETTDVAGGPIRANPDELIQEITDHAAAWNYLSQASALRSHAVLLVAATHDSSDENPERHAELAEAIRKEGGKLVRVVTFEDDHPFSSHRIALANTLTQWLRTDCAKTQTRSGSEK